MFITLEGPDGSGKTTQAALLVERLRSTGREVVAVHEPGGTELGTALRELLLQVDRAIDPWAEALLFAACRAQLVSEVIQPALARGATVVADRFSDSTLAYQGGGRGLPLAELRTVVRLAEGGTAPTLTVLLDLAAEEGLSRRRGDGPEAWTRFEREAQTFHERVRDAYLGLASVEPQRWTVVDAGRSVEEVAAEVWSAVEAKAAASST